MGYEKSASGDRIVSLPKFLLQQEAFLRTDNGTAQMNVNGAAGGTPVNLWNGSGGGGDAGADWSTNGIGAESGSAAHTGNNGWDSGVSTDTNDLTRFSDASDSDIDGTYSELSFWMQPKAFPVGARLRVDWQNQANTVIGDSVNVADYVTNYDLDVWQKVTIPISDFNLTGDVSRVRFRYRNATGQQFYFDDIELVPPGAGGPYRFRVAAPDALTQYHVSMLVLVVSGPSAGWSSATFANITALTNGLIIRQRRLSDSTVLWALNSKDNVDLFGRFHPQDDIEFSDGTLLVGFMLKPGKASVIVTDDEVLEFVVRDDLSALTTARGYAHYGVEVIT